MEHYYTIKFAAAYGEGAYGACEYSSSANSDCTTGAGTTTGTGGGSSSGLADTGTLVVLFASIACLIIFAAFVIRIWKRKPALQTAHISDAKTISNRDTRA
jgi:hypothetical protein